jgi:hypothetical protein
MGFYLLGQFGIDTDTGWPYPVFRSLLVVAVAVCPNHAGVFLAQQI